MFKKKKEIYNSMINICIDNDSYSVPEGSSLATVLMKLKTIAFNKFDSHNRAPVCNMGVCYECTAYVRGLGRIRACMTKVYSGMEVFTTNDYEIIENDEMVENAKVSGGNIEEVYDVAVIGAGPSGLGAVDELVGKKLNIIVIDEQEQPGGQIYRQPPVEFNKKGKNTKFVFRHRHATDIKWEFNTPVTSLTETMILDNNMNCEKAIEIVSENKPSVIARRVILGLGAYDRLLNVPGWELPGVMGAGAVQVFIKSQNYIPGEKILLSGTHPFILIVAQQIIEAGGNVKEIVFSQNFPNVQDFLKYFLYSTKQLGKSLELFSALKTVRKAKVPIHFGLVPTEIIGDLQYRKQINFSKVNSKDEISPKVHKEVYCDVLGMCYGFDASSELLRQIGCEVEYAFEKGGWIVQHDESMESSIPNIYVSGEITGVGGAELSEVEGRIAALNILEKLEKGNSRRLKEKIKTKESYLKFANMLAREATLSKKTTNNLLNQKNNYICKCERVFVQEIKNAITEEPSISSVNSLKLYTRCGMGLCQGRYCENSLISILEHEKEVFDIDKEKFNIRKPIKPVSIKQLLSK